MVLQQRITSPASSLSSVLASFRQSEQRREWLATRMHVLRATAPQSDAESALAAAAAALRERCCGQGGAVALLATSIAPRKEASYPGVGGRPAAGGGQDSRGVSEAGSWPGLAAAWQDPSAVPLVQVSAASEEAAELLQRLLCATPDAAPIYDSSPNPQQQDSSPAGYSSSAQLPLEPPTRRTVSLDDGSRGLPARASGGGGGSGSAPGSCIEGAEDATPAAAAAAAATGTSLAFLRRQARQGELKVLRSEEVSGGLGAFADWRVASRRPYGSLAPRQRLRATSCLLAVPGEETVVFCLIVQPPDGCVGLASRRR